MSRQSFWYGRNVLLGTSSFSDHPHRTQDTLKLAGLFPSAERFLLRHDAQV